MNLLSIERKSALRFVLPFFILSTLFSCTSVYKQLEADMVEIPSGTFMMGSDATDADLDECPCHFVSVDAFKLCRVEVSQRLWKSVMGINPSIHRGGTYPVEAVSYDDVLLFLKKLNSKTSKNYRLPTEVEWEYAASYGGDYRGDLDNYAWYENNSEGITHPCGRKKPNPLGLYDLVGNVFEWCSGVYDGCNYEGIKIFETDERDEEGVFRGGAFDSEPKYCRVKNRNHAVHSLRHGSLGFRIAE